MTPSYGIQQGKMSLIESTVSVDLIVVRGLVSSPSGKTRASVETLVSECRAGNGHLTVKGEYSFDRFDNVYARGGSRTDQLFASLCAIAKPMVEANDKAAAERWAQMTPAEREAEQRRQIDLVKLLLVQQQAQQAQRDRAERERQANEPAETVCKTDYLGTVRCRTK
jgi:hypothetical protein